MTLSLFDLSPILKTLNLFLFQFFERSKFQNHDCFAFLWVKNKFY